jgi:hypothetical protein
VKATKLKSLFDAGQLIITKIHGGIMKLGQREKEEARRREKRKKEKAKRGKKKS